jgi:ATP-binding cassette subfamily B protein
MKKIRQLLQFLRGQRLTFALTLLCVIVNVLFAATVPLIIRTGLDSVLGGKPVDLPAGLANVMGGADTIAWLNNNLWFMLVLLVGMTLMQGILLFGRGKLGAMTSEGAARRMRDRLYNHLERLPSTGMSRRRPATSFSGAPRTSKPS